MASVVRIKRKVGDDPHVALIAAKRRRTEAGDVAASTSADHETVLQFLGTMGVTETALPAAVLTSVKSARRTAKSTGVHRDPMSATAASLLAAKATERRLTQTEQQKAMRFKVVSRRRDLSTDISGSVIDVEKAVDEEATAAQPVGAATSPQLTCNGVPMERVSVDPAAAYVYDLYLASTPLEGDELDLLACPDTSLWELRTRGGSDSDAEPDTEDEDSNAEDNWRHDYPEELDDSDYDRYLAPDGECQLDLVRQLGAHRIADDSDDEPLAYGLEEASGAGGVRDEDAYERYKKRMLREMNGEQSDSDGDYYGDDDDSESSCHRGTDDDC